MIQSKTDPCVFYELNSDNKLVLITSVTVDDCAITGNEWRFWMVHEWIGIFFKIMRDGFLSKHLGVHYEWGTMQDGKHYCKATMDKKVDATVS